MMQKKVRVKQFALLAAAAMMILFAMGVDASLDTADPDVPERSDVIHIDAMTVFGSLERPPVEFLHDKHTEAVEKIGKDCLACHIQDETSGRLGIQYMRLENTEKQAVMDIYHANCIECHNQQLSAGSSTGPVVCAGCHVKTEKTVSNRQPVGMDSSLHYRHTKATDKKCETCHHEYDEATKKLVYVKGKEGTCRYCHQDQTEENRMALRQASHIACVDCHRDLAAEKKSAGPVQCAGCHNAGRQAMIEKIAEIPRMEMKQPDTVFVKAVPAETLDAEALRMNRVPFDHKAHETYNDTCRSCHHASMTGCVDCHTMPGKEEGDWVNLEQAMHRSSAGSSCVGCHEQKQVDKTCAGCHGFMTRTRQMPQTYCNTCHQVPLAEGEAFETPEMEVAAAVGALAARTPTLGTYDVSDIPETVTIKVLSEAYEPVTLPHRKIVSTLVKGVEDSELAKYFHTDPGTLCQGCHHNSPAAKKPPQCASCHGKPFQDSDMFRPGLMAAYHQQCMGCHDEMEIEKPASRDCAGCHKEKQRNTLISDPNI